MKKRLRRKRRLTPLQTHTRIFKSDKKKLVKFMKRNNIKSEANAIKTLFKKL